MSTVSGLPKQPVIYEINTAVFLSQLSKKYDRTIKLDSVPEEEWMAIAQLPVDAVWLMGVWERSPYSREASKDIPEFKKILPDYTEKDDLGSAYSIREYVVDRHFGGDDGLKEARSVLKKHGLGLILDFVPNHVACDHGWVREHPEYLIEGNSKIVKSSPGQYYESPHGIFAFGKDPEYPPWTDVLQLNAFSEGLRKAVAKTLEKIADQCDGVRCDMAMLLTNGVFEMTWGERAGTPASTEYWADVISSVRKQHPRFVFIAEVYWGFERRLLTQGFDYCYDKTLYDYLVDGSSLHVYQYVHAEATYQEHLLRFLENHDEPRASVAIKNTRRKAAAFITATLPGSTMYHQGQIEGYKVKLPVHLSRGPAEQVDDETSQFYRQLISTVAESGMRDGIWQLCRGTNGILRSTKLMAWLWTNGQTRFLCVANYNSGAENGHFTLPSLSGKELRLILGEEYIAGKGVSLSAASFSIGLKAWGYALFQIGL